MPRLSRRQFVARLGLGTAVIATTGVAAELLVRRPPAPPAAAAAGPTPPPPLPRLQLPALTPTDPPPADTEYDLLFAPNPVDASQVTGDFGLMRSASRSQRPGSPSAALIPGVSGRNAVAANDGPSSDALTWPCDGVLPADEFTIVFYIRSNGRDYVFQPAAGSAYHWSFDLDGTGASGLHLVRLNGSGDQMRVRWQYESLRLEAALGLRPGDIPADSWRRVVCTWDGAVLRIATGDNGRSAASPDVRTVGGAAWGASLAENAALTPSSSVLDGITGGIHVNGGGRWPAGSGGPFDVEGPYVYRYRRTFAAGREVAGRTLAIDIAGTPLAAFPVDVGGVLNQYVGMRPEGNAAGDADVEGRDALIRRVASAGLRTVRVPDLTTYPRFRYTPGGPDNGVSDYDWDDFDSRMTVWTRQGIDRFHADLMHTPPPLQPGPFPFQPGAAMPPGSTSLAAPGATSRMVSGTALYLVEGAVTETVFLTAPYAGGAGEISITPTRASFTGAAQVYVGLWLGSSAGNPLYAPAVDNAAWAQVCADAVDRLLNHHGVTVVHLGFWNEPLSANLYGGTRAAYVAQWRAAAERIHADPRIQPSGVKLAAGESATWVPDEGPTADTETGWQKAIVEEAAAASLPLPALSHHAYSGDINLELRLMRDQAAYLRARGFPEARIRVGEWNLDLVAAGDAADPATAAGAHADVWDSEYLAAFAHAFVAESISAGVDGMIFTRLQQLNAPPASPEGRLHLLSSADPAIPFPVLAYFEMLWKIPPGAVRFACRSNWPDIRVFGARSGHAPTTYTIIYGRYRPWRSAQGAPVDVALDWRGLPATFTWTRWHCDRTSPRGEGLHRVAAGHANDLPAAIALLPLSAGCIQLVG